MLNEEGGIDPLEFRFYAMTDRVATTATVWLGLTLGCAQCHTHKFDPIPHREYYQFMALLNNADEPEMAVPSAEIARRRHEIEEQDRRADRRPPESSSRSLTRRDRRRPAADRSVAKRYLESRFRRVARARGGARPCAGQCSRRSRRRANLPHLSIEADGSVFASGDQSKRDLYTLRVLAPT